MANAKIIKKLHNLTGSYVFNSKYTAIRTFIFSVGHYIIDISLGYFITGAKIELLAISSLLSPICNAIWYYILDKFFFSKLIKSDFK